jgi:streptogramin lyase
VLVALLLSAALAAGAKPAPPAVSAPPVQDSPVIVRITPHGRVRRLVCAVDRRRARTCTRTTRLRLSAGRHTIVAWSVGRNGRASPRRKVTVVVPSSAPAAVDVGGTPAGIAAAGPAIWVSGGFSGEVVRVDSVTRQVTARVQVGGQLGGVLAATAVWVSVFDGGEVARIDPATNHVVGRTAVGGQPTSIALDAYGRVWVGNLDGYASRIDPATGQVTATVNFPYTGVSTLLQVGGLLWAGLEDGSLVSIDPSTAELQGSPIPVGSDVDALVNTPSGLWASTFNGRAARIDLSGRAVVRRVKLPGKGSGVALADGRIWVSLFDRRLVVQLDPVTGALLGAVHTGALPRESVVVGGALWVADQGVGKLTPIPL